MVELLVLLCLLACLSWIAWIKERHDSLRELAGRMERLGKRSPGSLVSQGKPLRCRKEKGALPRSKRILQVLTPFSSRLPFPVKKVLLEQAGSDLTSQEFQSLRLLILASAGISVLLFAGPFIIPLALPSLALLAWIMPLIFLKRRIRRNQAAALDSLPALLDLLSLLLLSGQGLQMALRKASSACDGPLRDELDQVFRAMEMGVPRQQALARLEDRLPLYQIKRFVRSVSRAERFGAPLASVVESLATEMRLEKKARLRERAHKAPVKILFPLVFLILPSFLLLTVGGMLVGGHINL